MDILLLLSYLQLKIILMPTRQLLPWDVSFPKPSLGCQMILLLISVFYHSLKSPPSLESLLILVGLLACSFVEARSIVF